MSQELIEQHIQEAETFSIQSPADLENFRLKYLSKKGVLADLFALMKNIEPAERKNYGLQVNLLKQKTEAIFESFKEKFENVTTEEKKIDITLPGEPMSEGALHPLSIIRNRIIEIFSAVGFTVSDGPEIEDDWHNFTALNFPEEHPARDMQDTFFIRKNPDLALRTHTSSVQVRMMEKHKPPLRTISPGRVYRNEAISARAHCFFHQVEGLYIDKDVSFADLKQTLLYFAKEMFGADTEIRLRPSYFPFTEPSAEMDISCNFCKGEGCNICKYTGWVEILGCGMIDPAVLDNCKIDSNVYSGFAFGMGIERITMLVYNINDLRIFSENDVRFLKQFSGIG
ncbi:MAG: phenylalanine--tRNA ligase subunit alpha [Bacteroidetes bacterium]|jgi:phenylalanyl-tRNA synthetase alpha chain|nr:phenylalanine--tRNA ligase subunit alpha [Bacteroidota bacterium]MCC7514918.1 phenylalanine--tRNA ligase subunit alpha [Bacteroidia bacterium]MCW5920238.1 phenylalanine--tRNA ligase subunit alpha [Bacteroidota bacterium]HMU78112.1 phenylalanine--tRNA ligase subunit alpha [Bacteroidia bacterium]HMX97106.1 phenylalanine--tRNA ligase subunit alpha [Bacteroidia bacterium]